MRDIRVVLELEKVIPLNMFMVIYKYNKRPSKIQMH